MRATALLREAAASARGQRVATTMVALIVSAMCVATLLTVGRTVAAEAQVRESLERAGSLRIEITDLGRQGFILPSVVDVVSGFSVVDRAVGLTGPVAAVNSRVGSGGPDIAAWTVQGRAAYAVQLIRGRWPQPGEALVSEAAATDLGMDAPVGGLLIPSSRTLHSVVGSFRPRPGFADLGSGAVIAADPAAPSDSLIVVASSASTVRPALIATLALLARPDPSDLDVTSPTALADVQREVLDGLRFQNRLLVLLGLLTGALLGAIVVSSAVLMSRSDLGRRRALGAARTTLTMLVLIRTALIAGVAVLFGTGVAVAVTIALDQRPDPSFTAATAVLALLTAIVSAIAPAIAAAWQDPLKVLRTP